MARREDTGLHSAYLTAKGAYMRAPAATRDDMFIGALCIELLRELGDPGCSFVVGHEPCGKPASWDATGRALCPEHSKVVEEARRRRHSKRDRS